MGLAVIEEQGRVVSVEPGSAWVETVRQSTCGSCQARARLWPRHCCNASALAPARVLIRVLCDIAARVGEPGVIWSCPRMRCQSVDFLVIILPLVGLFKCRHSGRQREALA